MAIRYYKAVAVKRQPQNVRIRNRVQMSKEARAMLKTRQKQSRTEFQAAIDNAWAEIDEMTANIAEKHHKSFRTVQFALHMGRRQLTKHYRNKINSWNAYLWKSSQQNTKRKFDNI